MEFMTLDVAKRGIDFIVKNAQAKDEPQISIGYHGGGEPALNWNVLTGSWHYAKQRADRRHLRLHTFTATNGVLPNSKIDWIVEHLDGASVSFDGLPSIQDQHRPTASGRSSSGQVHHTLERFDTHDFNYQVRLTVTAALLPELVNSVQFICENFRVKTIHIEPVYEEGRGVGADYVDPDRFVEAFIEAEAFGNQRGRQVYYSAARLGATTSHYCGVTRDAFGLSATGNVSACYEAFSQNAEHADKFFYGELNSDGIFGFQFNMQVLNALRSKTVNNREYCQGCFAKWSCGGDCHVKHLGYEENEYRNEPPRCRITRQLTLHQILQKIQASGGLFWHEPGSNTP